MFLDPTSTTAQNGPLEWFLKWLAALGWPVIILGIWKLRGWLGGVEKKIEDTVETIKANGGSIKLVSDDLKKFKEFFELHIKEDEASFRAIREIVSDHAKAVGTAPQDIKALSDAVHHQAEVNSEVFKILRGIGEQQAVLATNQTNITSGFQRVVEQLISMMKE